MGEPHDDLARDLRQFTVGSYVTFYQPLADGIRVIHVVHGARDFESLF